ncbi:MAG TPA: hypothetical protein VMM76_23385 [Pirellulaceae bacterium]|nr:hypothetical protein [Pirellulaceae bacterium]
MSVCFSDLLRQLSGNSIDALTRSQASAIAGWTTRIGVGAAGVYGTAGDIQAAWEGDTRAGLGLAMGVGGGLWGTRNFRFCFVVDTPVARDIEPTEPIVAMPAPVLNNEPASSAYVWLAAAVGGVAVMGGLARSLRRKEGEGLMEYLEEERQVGWLPEAGPPRRHRSESAWSAEAVDQALATLFGEALAPRLAT